MTQNNQLNLLAQQIQDLLSADGFLMVNRNLTRLIGVNEAIIYSQLVALQKHYANTGELIEGGYFYATLETLELYTTLKKDTQARAIKNLENKWGLINTKKFGFKSKRHFRLTDNLPQVLVQAKKLEQETRVRLNEIKQSRKEDYLKFKEEKQHVSQNAQCVDKSRLNDLENAQSQQNQHIAQNQKSTFRKMRKVRFAKPATNNKDLINKDLNKKELNKIDDNKQIENLNVSYEVKEDLRKHDLMMIDKYLVDIESLYLKNLVGEDESFIQCLNKVLNSEFNSFGPYFEKTLINHKPKKEVTAQKKTAPKKDNGIPTYKQERSTYVHTDEVDEQKRREVQELLRALGEA
jgi:hypothetical protein